MNTHPETSEAMLARVDAELTRQDAEWRETQEQLLALGDVELSLDPATLAELESAAQPRFVGSIPAGLVRM